MSMVGRRRGKYSQAQRVLEILRRLTAQRVGLTLAAHASELGVGGRQIRRDLAALDGAGYVVDSVSIQGRAGVRLADAPTGTIQLSLRERYALLAVRRVFDVLEGTPLYEDTRSIFDKVTTSLPKEQRDLV